LRLTPLLSKLLKMLLSSSKIDVIVCFSIHVVRWDVVFDGVVLLLNTLDFSQFHSGALL
jgi:hypothetical protein